MTDQRLMRRCRVAMSGTASTNDPEIAEIAADKRLKLARHWQRGQLEIEKLAASLRFSRGRGGSGTRLDYSPFMGTSAVDVSTQAATQAVAKHVG